ncbi:MAG: hypothetical protein EZS28_050700, partial [Streblomastix strix]
MQVTHSNPNTSSSSTYTLFSIFKDEAKPQFTGATFTIALNAVMYVTKQSSNPILWTNVVPIDCYIDVDGHDRINTLCQLPLPNDFCVQQKVDCTNLLFFKISWAPTAITWHKTRADLNKQLGRQAQKNMIIGGTLKRIIV